MLVQLKAKTDFPYKKMKENSNAAERGESTSQHYKNVEDFVLVLGQGWYIIAG